MTQRTDRHRYMLPWVAMVHTATFLLEGLDEHLQESIGLSLLEQDFLSQLDKRGGDRRMAEFAELLLLSRAGMTKLVDRLEEAGLVERTPSAEDRRVTHVRLTPKGERLVPRSRELLESWVGENFGRLLSEEELDALSDTLRTVLEAHGRWSSQTAYLRGEGPHPDRAGTE